MNMVSACTGFAKEKIGVRLRIGVPPGVNRPAKQSKSRSDGDNAK